jgi:peptidoglycan/xylan/chitin deacetylase (PgdA/CDA1 family)
MRSSVGRAPRFLASEASLLYRRLRPARAGTARIVYYHRIDAEEHRSCVAPESFAAQMALLRREGWNVVSLREIATRLATGRSFAERTIAVTLDDGFADNYTAAFPVLARENIPATIFLTAGYIGTRALPVLSNHAAPLPLSWEQVTEMARHGIDFGAHTMTHRSLVELEAPEMLHEIVESRRVIEERAGVRVENFCYPRGFFNAAVKQVVRDAGYRLACSTMPGVVTRDTHPFSLRRTFIARDDSLRDFRKKLDGAFDPLHAALQWWHGADRSRDDSPGRPAKQPAA